MDASKIRAVAVDEDGTFLLSDGVSFDRARFARIFSAMEERGMRFAVATGNHHLQVRDIFCDYADRIGYVCGNGAHVFDGERLLRNAIVPDAVAREVIDAICAHPSYHVSAFGIDRVFVEKNQPEWFLEEMDSYTHCAEFVDSLYAAVGQASIFSGVSSIEEADAAMACFEAAVGGSMRVVNSGYEYGKAYFDLILPEVTKASGLRVLLDEWGISPDELVSFGDAGNDIEMLEMAGMSYAMENASDEVKAHAKRIAPANTASGVLTVLEELLGLA